MDIAKTCIEVFGGALTDDHLEIFSLSWPWVSFGIYYKCIQADYSCYPSQMGTVTFLEQPFKPEGS